MGLTAVRQPGLLDASLAEVGRLSPLSGSAVLKLIGSSEAAISIPEDSPAVNIHDWISLYTQRGFAGIFRVSNVSRTYKQRVDLTLLHGIDILSDSVWAAQTDFSGTKAEFLTALLNQQTHLINGVRPWVLGICQDNSTIEKSINYDRLSELFESLVEPGGSYYFVYDQTSFPWTVSYVSRTGEADSEFRLTRNVRSASVTYNDADLCTRLHLSVAATEQAAGGVRTYDNQSAQARWGIVVKTADIDPEEDHVASPDAWAADFLAQRSEPSVQIQIDGDELCQLTGDTWDELTIGKMCQVALPLYGHTFRERVVSVTYPDLYRDPSHVTVSLANTLPAFSEGIRQALQSAASSARGAARSAAAAEEEVKQYSTWQTKTDKLIGDYAKVTGVKLDANGDVVYEKDDQGNIILDENGNPIPVFDPESPYSLYGKQEVTAQHIIDYVGLTGIKFDAQGNPIYKQATDAQGNPIYDAQGNPVYETDANGNLIPDLDAKDGHSMYSMISRSLDEIDTKVQGKASAGEVRTLADKVGMFITANGDIDAAAIFIALNGDGTTSAYIRADKIQLDGTAIISAIEGAKAPDGQTRLKISADSLDLSGVLKATAVTAQGVTTYKISGKELVTAVLTAGTLKLPKYGSHVDTTEGAANAQKWTYEPLAFTFGTVGKGDGAKTYYYVGYGNGIYSQSLNHTHDISFDNTTGVLTLGQPILGSNQTTNFNVASSTWFKNQMAGARAEVRLTSLSAPTQTLAGITRLGPDDQLTHYYLPIRYALGYDEDDGDGGTQTVTIFPTGGGTAENIVLVDSLIRNIASSMSFTTGSSDPSNNDLTAGSTVNGSWQDGAVRSYSSSTGKAWITVKAQLDTGIVGSDGSTRIVVSGTQDVEIDVSDIAGSSQGGSAGSVTITAADLGGSDQQFADRINARQDAAATLSKTTSTDLSISINARGVYNQGLYDGWDKAAAKVVYPKVSPATITNGISVVYPAYTESAATQSNYYNTTASAEYFLNTGAEDGVYYAYIRYSNVNTGAIVAKRNIQSIYTAGQNSVTPTSAQLSQVVLSESSGIVTAKGTLTVPYTGNATGASLEVDVTDIYDIGYDNGAEVSSYTASFDVTMTAPDGFTRVVRVDNVDCADAYNAGARAAASQTTYKYVWGDHTDTASRTFPLWATADSAYSTIAQIPRNTQVELLDTSGSYAHITYTLNGVTHTGYTRAVYMHDGPDEIITWYACELHGNLLSVYTGSTSSVLEGRLYPMTEVVEHTYWGTSNRAYIVCDGRYGYIDRIDLYYTRAGTSNYGQQTGWYSAATTMYIYNTEGEPVTVFMDDLLSSPYSKTIYPNTPVTVSNYSASAYSVMFTYDGGTYYIMPQYLSGSANSPSNYNQTGWYNGGGTTSYETLGVYSTGFNLNNCHVGVKYPDSGVLVVFNLLGSEEAVQQYPGDLYGTNTTNRMPVAVYASSQSYPESEAVGRTCYVLLSDGTKKQFTIQDSEPTT